MSNFHLMHVEEIRHYRNGKCIWEAVNLPNVWHVEGQEFLLSTAFNLDSGIEVPDQYYLGLDNRTTIQASDTISDVTSEPTGNGYVRQAFSSTTGFVVALKNGRMTATSGIATFVATGDSWGPIQNVFLTTAADDTGFLIATTNLGGEQTVQAGDSVSVRINLSFAGCS